MTVSGRLEGRAPPGAFACGEMLDQESPPGRVAADGVLGDGEAAGGYRKKVYFLLAERLGVASITIMSDARSPAAKRSFRIC